MDKLFSRHDSYMADVPMEYVRNVSRKIDWGARLIIIKGAKGVGKSTIMQQHIKNTFSQDDRSVLYCSADSGYFTTHTLEDTADRFVLLGGKYLFIDEIHKYPDWSREIKSIYDLHKGLHIVLSGSSLVSLNDGDADLSRRMVPYFIPGLSFREYLHFEKKTRLDSISLEELLAAPNSFCSKVKNTKIAPVAEFRKYLSSGFYPYSFESGSCYQIQVENVVDYIINNELPLLRKIEVGNSRKLKALLKIISQMVPYEVDIAKLSKAIGIQRGTLLKYIKDLEEAQLIMRLFQNLSTITDLQKPDKIYLDNPNLIYTLSDIAPQIGTVRECFFCNQLRAAGHKVEYGGYAGGDFRIDNDIVIEVGGADKDFSQISGIERSYVAADDIDTALPRKIPLWTFGFLY